MRPASPDLIQAQARLRSLVVLSRAVTDLTEQRVWMGTVVPDNYDPSPVPGQPGTGPGVLLTLQAGQPNSTGVYTNARVFSRAIARTQMNAWRLDQAVAIALEGRSWTPVKGIRTIQSGSLTTYPGHEWPVVMRIFELVVT
jgi:hypothetical protein